jgi:hypothetical protein
MAWGPLSGSSSQVITSAGIPFTPGDISSCALWLESKAGITDVSTKVSVWDDTISGTTNSFTQTTDANRPTLTPDIFGTGVSSVKPDGTNDVMLRADTSALDALVTEKWMFIFRIRTNASVVTGTKTYISKDDGSTGYYHGESHKGGTQKWWMAMRDSDTYTQWYGSTTVTAETTYTVEMHNISVAPGVYTGAGWRIYIDGVAETMTANDQTMTGDGDNDAGDYLFSRGASYGHPNQNFGCIGFFNADMLDPANASDLASLRTYISENYP